MAGGKQIVFLVVKGSTIRNFLILEVLTGSSMYYLLKVMGLGLLISSLGSAAGVEGFKWIKRIKTAK